MEKGCFIADIICAFVGSKTSVFENAGFRVGNLKREKGIPMKHINIAVDGPAGAGKSTVSRAVARELGIIYLDTGAMYRALGLKAVRLSIDPNDESGVMTFLPETRVEIEYREGVQHILLDGEDVSQQIRQHEISKAASDISKIPAVRIRMVELQREIAAANDVIMDGRDIGSYVLPDAPCKFYLDARPEVRAARRVRDLEAKGQTASFEEILRDIVERDRNDSTRAFAPLKCVEDAVRVDTSDMSEEQVIAFLVEKVRQSGR